MFQQAAKARDQVLEATVFSFLYNLLGEYIQLERDGVQFDFSKGHVSFQKMEFKNAVKKLVNKEFAKQELKLKMVHGFLQHIELTEFYPQDVLDGDFDYPLSAKINGLVLVLEPTEDLEEVVASPSTAEAGEEPAPTTPQEAKGNMLLETFLQGFGHIEITKVHIRYQDPLRKVNVALNIGMGQYGSIKVWEPTEGPMSFRSVDKENEGKEKPLQDVVKQFFFPFPSIEINPYATEMIGANYNFEAQSNSCAVIAEGSLFTCSLALDSRNLGKDVTIHDPQLRNPLVFRLDRDQIKTVLDIAKHLKPKEMENPDISIGADVLDTVGVTIGWNQLEHFLLKKLADEALPEDRPGFFVDREARVKISPSAIHSEDSFQHASAKSFRRRSSLRGILSTPSNDVPPTMPIRPVESLDEDNNTPKQTVENAKKLSGWQRMKAALSCRKISAVEEYDDGDDEDTILQSETDQNFTQYLGENAMVVPVQIDQSWGGSFDGLELVGPLVK